MNDTDFGYIVVNVRLADGALPCENAIVTIKDSKGELIAVYFTNRFGATKKLKVPAPPKNNSDSPNSLPAFFNYNIDTDKEGFRSVRNLDVPVYPGITSIQPVELIPLAEGSSVYPENSVIFTEGTPPNL